MRKNIVLAGTSGECIDSEMKMVVGLATTGKKFQHAESESDTPQKTQLEALGVAFEVPDGP